MKYTTFNIGLNNNPFNYEQLARFINKVFGTTNEKVEIQLRNGTYEGDSEPTAVVRVTHLSEYQDDLWAEMMAAILCAVCTQECIPYRHVVADVVMAQQLVYNPQFEGEKYTFDPAYFIDFADEVN
jgi:hypothetical protein